VSTSIANSHLFKIWDFRGIPSDDIPESGIHSGPPQPGERNDEEDIVYNVYNSDQDLSPFDVEKALRASEFPAKDYQPKSIEEFTGDFLQSIWAFTDKQLL
jgi:hypothetical protein